MVEYFDNGDLAVYNGFSFRRDKRTNYYLSSRAIGERRKRLHVYIWEQEKGEIPKGFQVHHIDGNKFNNCVENYSLLSASKHSESHGRTLTKEQKDCLRKNIIEKAQPKAKEWHGSEDGIKWHKEHYGLSLGMVQLKDFTCEQCGKNFKSKYAPRFCSNNCKSAYRRKQGVDNVEKICSICGKVIVKNKYSKNKCCGVEMKMKIKKE